VSRDATGQVRVVGWGFWGPDVAQAFDKSVLSGCRLAGASRLVLDMTDLKPMRDEGQRAFASTLTMLKMVGVTQAVLITSSPLTKLQLLRIVKDSGAKDLVLFA
jgi:hypothetical protein